ncbi:MAG TPA: DUF480 domain-containing protein [Planctomycetota bacterium]|jgi:hypothetical protein|nr:DUF480 domain-containing protein [Planctomycetota bacterium]
MAPQIALNEVEARVLGVLVEKAMTTPDQYPLSLHAATAGCNQKNNRLPLVEWTEAKVHVGLQGLAMKHLAGRSFQAGGRVEKFRHNGGETLGVDDAHLAVLAELLMRGPQQPGELRSRVERMTPTPTLEALQARLAHLIEKGYVQRIDPGAGSRAERYVQLLAAGLHPLDAPAADAAPARAASPSGLEARVSTLEGQVGELRAKIEGLLSQLGA